MNLFRQQQPNPEYARVNTHEDAVDSAEDFPPSQSDIVEEDEERQSLMDEVDNGENGFSHRNNSRSTTFFGSLCSKNTILCCVLIIAIVFIVASISLFWRTPYFPSLQQQLFGIDNDSSTTATTTTRSVNVSHDDTVSTSPSDSVVVVQPEYGDDEDGEEVDDDDDDEDDVDGDDVNASKTPKPDPPAASSKTGPLKPPTLSKELLTSLSDDCRLKLFAAEYSMHLQPSTFQPKLFLTVNLTNVRAYWYKEVFSGFQIGPLCKLDLIETTNELRLVPIGNTSSLSNTPPNPSAFISNRPTNPDINCLQEVFVDPVSGKDSNAGDISHPFLTIQHALDYARKTRSISKTPKRHEFCITLRQGTFYLGQQASYIFSSGDSRIGAIELHREDSGLTIRAKVNEDVVLSAGYKFSPAWEVHTSLPNGKIFSAKLPKGLNFDAFHLNELYINNERAIRARYPNANPSTQGLHTNPSGWIPTDRYQWRGNQRNGWPEEVHIATEKFGFFTEYQIGKHGPASIFDPPQSFWATNRPPWGDRYQIPDGLRVGSGVLPNINRWTNVTDGFVHAFHGVHWAGWTFHIKSVNQQQLDISLGDGGFQDARGNAAGSEFYIDNIFEELDSPMEWYVDRDSNTLYFYPNSTVPPTEVVLSQLACVISMQGNQTHPVDSITVDGLTIAHTANTFMRPHTVPSGGDWAFHRGGAVYLEGTQLVNITHNLFTNLGGNAIMVSSWNRNVTIMANEFAWLGDSSILLVGLIDGLDDGVTSYTQPADSHVISNIFHETGIYTKQTAGVFVALARSVTISGNVFFNMPRAAININDEFYGGLTISHNLIFNTVRETKDHAGINTWDRQPYRTLQPKNGAPLRSHLDERGLTVIDSELVPSLNPQPMLVVRNFVLANYFSMYCLDNDDGSQFYNDSENFYVYCPKKNFLGNFQASVNNLYVYPDSNGHTKSCFQMYTQDHGHGGYGEVFMNNTCILHQTDEIYIMDNCVYDDPEIMAIASNNRFYVPENIDIRVKCKRTQKGNWDWYTFKQYQAYGYDLGSTELKGLPSIDQIIAWGRLFILPNS